jgi:hypothetical protein
MSGFLYFVCGVVATGVVAGVYSFLTTRQERRLLNCRWEMDIAQRNKARKGEGGFYTIPPEEEQRILDEHGVTKEELDIFTRTLDPKLRM